MESKPVLCVEATWAYVGLCSSMFAGLHEHYDDGVHVSCGLLEWRVSTSSLLIFASHLTVVMLGVNWSFQWSHGSCGSVGITIIHYLSRIRKQNCQKTAIQSNVCPVVYSPSRDQLLDDCLPPHEPRLCVFAFIVFYLAVYGASSWWLSTRKCHGVSFQDSQHHFGHGFMCQSPPVAVQLLLSTEIWRTNDKIKRKTTS